VNLPPNNLNKKYHASHGSGQHMIYDLTSNGQRIIIHPKHFTHVFRFLLIKTEDQGTQILIANFTRNHPNKILTTKLIANFQDIEQTFTAHIPIYILLNSIKETLSNIKLTP
jgi:hypothetical protein